MGIPDHYKNKPSRCIKIYLFLLKVIALIFSFLYSKILKPTWKLINKINLNSIALLISLLINLCLVWFGALGLEYSNHAVLYTPTNPTINPFKLYIVNSGRSAANYSSYVVAVKAKLQKGILISKEPMVSNIIKDRIFPNEKTSLPVYFADSAFTYPIDSLEVYLMKWKWSYESFFPDIIPYISNYSDSIYIVYRVRENEWIRLNYPSYLEYSDMLKILNIASPKL